jgi:hypothetical protein
MSSTRDQRDAPKASERNRRIFPRRRTTFPATYVVGGGVQRPAFGLDISGGGMCLLAKDPIPVASLQNLEVFAMIGARRLHFSAGARWAEPFEVRGQSHHRYGLKLKAIADSDWDYVMEHSLEAPNDAAVLPGKPLSTTQRDWILSAAKQDQIAAALTTIGRLRHVGGKLPLVEYTFGGYVMQRGIAFYKFLVRSRNVQPDQTTSDYLTTVAVAIEGDTVRILD